MFSWKESKREKVIAGRGMDFAQMTDVFDDPFALYFEDYEHSTETETHFKVIGQTAQYGLIFVVFTYETESDIFLLLWEKLKIGW